MTATQAMIGDYLLTARIGRGAMGTVYHARHATQGQEVAIKLLPPELANDPTVRGYFWRGATSAAALRHPNILPTWYYGEQQGTLYLITPYIRGGTLFERLVHGPLAPAEALGYLRQLTAALDYAHAQGIIHRDIKPANLLLDEHGRLYLADFGIAKAMEYATRYTRTGQGVGTAQYMAPEQARGQADARSDLYAAGIILYELLTGRTPYNGTSPIEVLMQHREDPLPLVPLYGLPPAIVPVLQAALAKDPAARYQRGADLAAAAEAALFSPPPAAPRYRPTTTVVPQPQPWAQVAAPVVPQPINNPPVPRFAAVQPRRTPFGTVLSIALALTLLFGTGGGFGAWLVRPYLVTATTAQQLGGAAPTAGTQPTPRPVAASTATVPPAASASPPPAPSQPPVATATAPTAPITPVAVTNTAPNSVPAGWRTYRGTTLPFAIAYPPDWRAEEHLADKYVIFRSPTPGVFMQVMTYGGQKPRANIDVERDGFNNAFRAGCDGSGIERTANRTISALTFATLFATCDKPDQLYAYDTGAALFNGVPWYYVAYSPYGTFDANNSAAFAPMLASLNIFASR